MDIYLKGNKVGSYFPLLINDDYVVYHSIDFDNVSISKHEIKWEWIWDGSAFNRPKQVLNRQTLELISFWWGEYKKRICVVYESSDSFFLEMEKIKIQYQSRYDRELKENKI